ncbi:MBL fold metallo-hydrolase [Paenibacillus roseus]|uniref:MBL fold metallo-hydrolase n=1 Tax=Paenibacillus roseus TaxID=2798579 RepID=UPI002FCE3FD9
MLNPVVIRDGNSYILVDTGTPGSHGPITELLTQAGIDPSESHSIILTHQDIDHIGSLPQFKGEGVDVYAYKVEQPYIDGLTPLAKYTEERIEELLAPLPQDLAAAFRDTFSGEVKNVTRLLEDGERLPFGGGLTVIHTPGHTAGHICLYHEPSKTLIAGDALMNVAGKLQAPPPAYNTNTEEAIESIRKLQAYPIERLICYHGGIFEGDVHEAIEELTGSLQS